jgi:1,2-diacylglycerol 3-alpha-glucosyltransferase
VLERPLRIAQVACFPFPSAQGSQVYVHGMSRALARRGHQVTVACYGHGQGEVDPAIRLLRAPSLPGYANLRAGPDPVKPWLDLAMALQLAQRARDFDVIHAHNYEAPLVGYVARAVSRVPVVYNNHNTLGEELPTYFEGARARRLAGLCGRLLDHSVPRLADASVAISEEAVPLLRSLGCRRVSHVPPGVDPEDLVGGRRSATRARLGLGERPWVIYAGNPDAYQDLGVLVDAVCRLPELGLLMVSASSLEAWASRASSLPTERKRFVVTSSWPEVRDLLAAADLAGLPRRVCSGYPIKLLNYLGMGLPTVACRGSARDIAGVIPVDDGDVEAFAEALQALASDPGRREELGRSARADVLERFTWEACAVRLEQVYGGLLREAG